MNLRDRLVTEGRAALERATWPPCIGQDQHDTFAAKEIAETVVDAVLAAMTEETRSEHYYWAGQVIRGYGSYMDLHRCGDLAEPCRTVTEVRWVTPWEETP